MLSACATGAKFTGETDMKNQKLFALAFLAYGLNSYASPAHHCVVTGVPHQHAGFLNFPGLPQLPIVGDAINLDLSANEISDLTFESGRAIAIKQKKAVLSRRPVPAEMGNLASFKGSFKSPTGDYTGVAFFFLDGAKASGNIEIARLKFYEGFNLARYTLECTQP
jgi:hypothetical protein